MAGLGKKLLEKRALDVYSETLNEAEALEIARHAGPVRLHRLESLDALCAEALVCHQGRDLALPSVRLLSDEVASILASYTGTLRLDGLWILANVPLAQKLASQWKEQGEGIRYPNLSVQVADALELWPQPTEMWPPSMSEDEGAKHLYEWQAAAKKESTSSLQSNDWRAITMWLEFTEQRSKLLAEFLREHNEQGFGLSLIEAPGLPSPVSVVAASERKFCTTFWITDIRHKPFPEGWFYINTDHKCIGPVTQDAFDKAQDKPDTYFYWVKEREPTKTVSQAIEDKLDELNAPQESGDPRISEIRIGPSGARWQQHAEVAGLACLVAAEQVWQHAEECYSNNTMEYDFQVDSVCRDFQRLESLTNLACELCPELKHIPNVDHLFDGRAICIGLLEEVLERRDEDLKLHIKKWIRRLRKQ